MNKYDMNKNILYNGNLSIATTSGPQTSGLNREGVSLQRSKSIVQVLLGHKQVVLTGEGSLYRGQNQLYKHY